MFIKNLQTGIFSLPSTIKKYKNWVFILRTIRHHERCDLAIAFKTFHLHFLLSICTCILLSDAISDQYGLSRRIRWQGNSRLTVCLHGQFFHAFHLWGVTRFQHPPPFPLTTFIGIGMEPNTHEWFRRCSQVLQDKPSASKPCKYSNETNISDFFPCNNHYPSLLVTSGHDLTHIPYEILGSCISGVFTPLDFKYCDARYRKTTHLDWRPALLWIWWTRSFP